MKTFNQWLVEAGYNNFLPNMGQQAMPINQQPQFVPQPQQPQQPQQTQPQQQNLPTMLQQFSNQVKDMNWVLLYELFEKHLRRAPGDPEVSRLGQTLLQTAQTGNMAALQPFVQKHFHAIRAR